MKQCEIDAHSLNIYIVKSSRGIISGKQTITDFKGNVSKLKECDH